MGLEIMGVPGTPAGAMTVIAGAMTWTGCPSFIANVVRKTSCLRTISSRLWVSAARSSRPVRRTAEGMLYIGLPGSNRSRNHNRSWEKESGNVLVSLLWGMISEREISTPSSLSSNSSNSRFLGERSTISLNISFITTRPPQPYSLSASIVASLACTSSSERWLTRSSIRAILPSSGWAAGPAASTRAARPATSGVSKRARKGNST